MDVLFLEDINHNMTREEFITTLKKIVQPYIQDEEAFHNLTEDTDFVNDLKINSANLVDVILDVEDEFDIEIDDEELADVATVGQAVNLLHSKI